MDVKKWGLLGLAGLLLVSYNFTQPGLVELRSNQSKYPGTNKPEAYGPSLAWVDRLARANSENTSVGPNGELKMGDQAGNVKLDFSVMSSLMVAGLASGFKSQVANLLWMKSDEYWHQGLFTRQVPLMEAVVTLDPQFIDAWSTAGWHWAYNIYADIPQNPDYKAKGEKAVAAAQQNAVATGLDYLKRGSNLNPDTYRLWFEHGWTRAEKAGLYDEETLNLYRTARTKSDAREIEIMGPGGKPRTEQGLDLMGRTIGHLLERIPEFDRALDHYAGDLMKATPTERAELDKVGKYWALYGSKYDVIAQVYQGGDEITKEQVRKLVPDVDELVKAHQMRQTVAARPGADQPVGAYSSISARYMPAWKLMKAGNISGAIEQQIGVMNADPRFHLQGLPTLAKIMELRGDAPVAIQAELKATRQAEKESSQDLGLHFLATLYEMSARQAQKAGDTGGFKKANTEAYRTWYRSRERDALDFYALRNTRTYETKYGFTPPADIIKAIKESRKGGVPNAAPALPPTRDFPS